MKKILVWLTVFLSFIVGAFFFSRFSIRYSYVWLLRRDLWKLRPYIVAQSQHETGDYTSPLYRNYNNAFGMKVPDRRAFNRKGEVFFDGSFYSTYYSPSQSLADFFLYLDAVNFPKQVDSVAEYVFLLKTRKYFEASSSEYLSGMTHFLSKP